MASDMFIKIKGIEGGSLDHKHANEIDVVAWSWGLSNATTAHMGSGSGSGKVNVHDLSFTKPLDKATTALITACAKGAHIDEAVLVVRKAGNDPLEYLKIKLKQVFVTSVSKGGSRGEEMLMENITLSFAQFEVIVQPQDENGGKKGGEVSSGFDVAKNKPL